MAVRERERERERLRAKHCWLPLVVGHDSNSGSNSALPGGPWIWIGHEPRSPVFDRPVVSWQTEGRC